MARIRSWKRRKRTCLCIGCDTKFLPAVYDDWFCCEDHRALARKGESAEPDGFTMDEKQSMRVNLAEMEKNKPSRRGIRFGRGLKNPYRETKPDDK